MKELVFQVEFESEVVLPASSNTEGNIEQLDFIPGSNFLGMVASKYSEFQKRGTSFDVFHSGKVRFGDATLLKDSKPTYKVPLSYVHEKLDESKIYNHHFIEEFEKFEQLKQVRNGYITEDKELFFVDYNYSQKSAYSKEHRRSKDSSMFGYKAIKSATKWQFSLKYDKNLASEDVALIKQTLLESTRLGKSKSAQYGEVKITQNNINNNPLEESQSDEIILYANSRLALVDEAGNPTYDLKYLCDGLRDEDIDYKYTQIKTSTFTPHNGARQTKDYERLCINKGSVIVLENIKHEQCEKLKEKLKNGVGMYLNEGFGEILMNPSFLMDKGAFKLTTDSKKDLTNEPKIKEPIKDKVALFLQQKQKRKDAKLNLSNRVYKFIKYIEEHKELSDKKINSQWGAVRSLALQATDSTQLYDLLFDKKPEDKPAGFLMSKTSKAKWNQELVSHIKNEYEEDKDNYIEFIKLLAMKMPRVKNLDEPQKELSDEN